MSVTELDLLGAATTEFTEVYYVSDTWPMELKSCGHRGHGGQSIFPEISAVS